MPDFFVGIDARRATVGAGTFRRAKQSIKQDAAQIDRSLRGLGSQIGVLSGLGGALSGAFVLRTAISEIREFETEMSGARAVTGAVGAEFEALSDTARQMGATTVFSAKEAASAIRFLGQTGFSTVQILQALPSTLDLAVAGSLDLGRAADIASNLLKAFNLETSEMTRVADTLARVAASSNTNVAQLSEAMKFAAPAAAALGLDIESTSAAIGLLGDAGIQASLAGTSVRRFLIATKVESEKTREALLGLGLSMGDIDVESRGLIPVLETLRDKNLDLGAAVQIFGLRGANAALLLSQFSAHLKRLDDIVRNSETTAASMARIMQDNLGGSIKATTSAAKELVLGLGVHNQGLSGALRSVLDQTTDVLRVLAGMDDNLKGNARAANLLADAVRGLATALSVLAGTAIVRFLLTTGVGLVRLTTLLSPARLAVIGLAEAFVFMRRDAASTRVDVDRLVETMEGLGETTSEFNLREAIGQADAAIKQIDEELSGTSAAKNTLDVWQTTWELVGIAGQLAANTTAKAFRDAAPSTRLLLDTMIPGFATLEAGAIALANRLRDVFREFDPARAIAAQFGQEFDAASTGQGAQPTDVLSEQREGLEANRKRLEDDLASLLKVQEELRAASIRIEGGLDGAGVSGSTVGDLRGQIESLNRETAALQLTAAGVAPELAKMFADAGIGIGPLTKEMDKLRTDMSAAFDANQLAEFGAKLDEIDFEAAAVSARDLPQGYLQAAQALGLVGTQITVVNGQLTIAGDQAEALLTKFRQTSEIRLDQTIQNLQLERVAQQTEGIARGFLSIALASGRFGEAVEVVNGKLVITDQKLSRVNELLLETEKSTNEQDTFLTNLGNSAQTFGSRIGSSFQSLISGAATAKQAVAGLVAELARAVIQAALLSKFGGSTTSGSATSGIVGGVLSGLVGSLLAFQTGGSFRVGGSGPPDSQLFNLALTPGEAVNVTRPGESPRSGESNVVVNINTSPDIKTEVENTRRPDGTRVINAMVINTMRKDARRQGPYIRQLQGHLGAERQGRTR